MNVATRIQVGGSSLANGAWLRVRRGMGAIAGSCDMVVPSAVGLTASPGDPVAASVGLDGDPEPVFQGTLDAAESRSDHLVFRALDDRVKAAHLRLSQVFEDQTTDSIIHDLANAASLTVGRLATGTTVRSYWVDDGKNALQHMDRLAALGGAHVFVDVAGKLQTASYVPPPPSIALAHGSHLLAVRSVKRQGGGKVEIRTEGAASVNGPPAAFWPTTDTAKVAGTSELASGPHHKWFVPELRTMAGALIVAAAWGLQRIQKQRRVQLRCTGQAEIELGDTITLTRVPGADAVQLLRVVAIEHRVNPWDGFVTELVLEGVG